jgi:hypothetical protein
MDYLQFPAKDDWNEIYKQSPFVQIKEILETFRIPQEAKGFNGLFVLTEMVIFYEEFENRIADLQKSYIFMMYFFGRGIPDNPWFISPSLDGKKTIQYFPEFEDIHYINKDWFDYFSEMFYFKYFSAFDVGAHMLKIFHNLEIKKPSFELVVSKLEDKNATLFNLLNRLRREEAYLLAKKVRNDITHNRAPSSNGMEVVRGKNAGSLGVRKDYILSETIVENVRDCCHLLKKLLVVLHESFDAAVG